MSGSNSRFAKSEQQLLAESLCRSLAIWRVASSPVGSSGENWHVEVSAKKDRSARIDCFHYPPDPGFVTGVNPANGRSRLGPDPRPWRAGPEYLLTLTENGLSISGRTRDRRSVVKAVRLWHAGVTQQKLARLTPFVDEDGRALRSFRETLDLNLVERMGETASRFLWVSGFHACELEPRDGHLGCSYRYGQAQVAFSYRANPETVRAWLLDESSVSGLAAIDLTVSLENHVEHIESDPALWHWLNVLDRVDDSEDVLHRMKRLVTALADDPTVSKFYSYSSMATLRFSASSHYPWVGQGFPTVLDATDDQANVDGVWMPTADAVSEIAHALRASLDAPFFGTFMHLEIEEVRNALAHIGSPLLAKLVLRSGWFIVTIENNGRRCEAGLRSATFGIENDGPVYTSWVDTVSAASALHRYLIVGEHLEAVLNDSRCTWRSDQDPQLKDLRQFG